MELLPVLAPAVDDQPIRKRLPHWLRREIPSGFGYHATAKLIDEFGLETVCESAKCPNRSECWSSRTATFMVMGDVCTRPCGFCSVKKGRTQPLQEDEPHRVAQAAARLGLAHVVITSVSRDDLPDGGAEHFYRCVLETRRLTGASIEVLTPDFIHCKSSLRRVIESSPEVFNHNTETVPRLYRSVRGSKSDYRWTLELLEQAKKLDPQIKTKSGLMLGLGETHQEILDTLADLRDVQCDFLTLGQYLQPTPKHLPVAEYVHPDEFEKLGNQARSLGFAAVASGPFVRSSYHAREMVVETRS
jgi:lipoic acid synthetase